MSTPKQHTFLIRMLPAFIKGRIEHRPGLVNILDNIGWLFVDKIMRMGVGLLVGVWVARYLGPEQFGLFNFATALVVLFGTVAGLGLQDIVVRDIVRDSTTKEETLGSSAVLQLLSGLITYGLILVTIFWMRPDDLLAKALVAILGSMLLFKASDVVMFWFESQVLSKYTVWLQNGSFLVFALIKVSLILNNAPLTTFAWATMAEALMVALLLAVMLSLRGPGLSQLRCTLMRTKSLLKDSWPLMLSSVAIIIYTKIDQIMLGQMVGNEAVGIYSAALRISEVWYFIPMVIGSSVFPAILEAKKRSETDYIKRLQYLYDALCLFTIPLSGLFWIYSDWIVNSLYGVNFKDASPILMIHIWNTVLVSLGVARGKWLLAENLQKFGTYYIGISLMVNIAGNYLLIPHYGGVGAAWATLISTLTATIIAPYIFKETRLSVIMLLRSFQIWRLPLSLLSKD
jgi:PST family polysaccharide transporter